MIKHSLLKFKENTILKVNDIYPVEFEKDVVYTLTNSKKGNPVINLNNKYGWVRLNKNLLNDITEVVDVKFYDSRSSINYN